MESLRCYLFSYPASNCSSITRFSHGVVCASRSDGKKHHIRKKLQLPKNLRHRRRTEIPPDFHPSLHRVQKLIPCEETPSDSESADLHCDAYEEIDANNSYNENITWDPDEIEAISSLFQGRIPQKPGKLNRRRPFPLPLPHKIQPLGLPTPKQLTRTNLACSARQPISNHIYKSPTFLISLAKDIKNLPPEDNVSKVLDPWAPYLRKGSLSLTIRELGHMGHPGRVLPVFNWVQNQPHLFPDDRVLASTVEVLARAHELKMPLDLEKFISLTSQSVYEAMVKGFIKGGNLRLARKLISAATECKRVLDTSLYAKLILELGKNPDRIMSVLPLLEELAKREDLKLSQQDCTAIMKVCIRLGKFDVVEVLYDWFKKSGKLPSVVMYTTLIHSRYLEGRYRDAMDIVWEMEASGFVLDLPSYRVLIKLFVALNDLSRVGRYFSKLKESGFAPTYDIYREVVAIYAASGRLAKCKEICHEAEMSGVILQVEK